jgi:hypothetical protein
MPDISSTQALPIPSNANVPILQHHRTAVTSEVPALAGRIREPFAAGASHVAVHSAQPDQERVIAFYGREVLPAVRGS